MERLRFVAYALRCGVEQREPMDLEEQAGLVRLLDDLLLEAKETGDGKKR